MAASRDVLRRYDSHMASRECLLTVIVPVYNEVRTVSEVLQRVIDTPFTKQVIVVDDGSCDGSGAVLRQWSHHPHVELMHHTVNRGKGTAIRNALENAIGRYTVIQDADLECDPRDYAVLMEPLLLGTAEVVFGSRYRAAKDIKGMKRWVFWSRGGVCILNFVVWLLYGVRLSDQACCYKVLPTSLLRNLELKCRRFEFCAEVTAKVIRSGFEIHEVPVSYHRRAIAEGKKRRLRDGFCAVAALWRCRHWCPKQSAVGMRPGSRVAISSFTQNQSRQTDMCRKGPT